jgi:urease accessory protein
MSTPIRAHLPFAARSKSRLLVCLENGERAALVVARGRVLQGGEHIALEDGRTVEIVAADESLLEAVSADPLLLARAAYHLGNRHVAVQFMTDAVRFLADHVLGEMVAGLGLEVRPLQAPFEPEGGAYGRHAHSHPHAQPDHHPHADGNTPSTAPKIHSYTSS